MKYLLLLILFVFHNPLSAFQQGQDIDALKIQEKDSGKTNVSLATPGVLGDRPSKGIVLSYNLIGPFDIQSVPIEEGLEGEKARLRKLEEIRFSLRLPISWSGPTKIIAGLQYFYEEYNFQNPEGLETAFYQNLENKHLNSLSVRTYILHSLSDKKFIGARLGAELNGDYHGLILPFQERMKFSVAGLYGWKPNPYASYGVGIYYSYTMGRPSIYPAFLWNRTYSEKWGVEALLPQSFRLRYTFSPKAFLLGGLSVSGRSYHIVSEESPLAAYPNLELRNSNLYAFAEFEREIYDFLWIGLTGGLRYNVNFYISEENTFSNSRIVENKVGASPYLNISLFVVPPRSLLKSTSEFPETSP